MQDRYMHAIVMELWTMQQPGTGGEGRAPRAVWWVCGGGLKRSVGAKLPHAWPFLWQLFCGMFEGHQPIVRGANAIITQCPLT